MPPEVEVGDLLECECGNLFARVADVGQIRTMFLLRGEIPYPEWDG